MDKYDIQSIIDSLTVVDSNIKYWFMRTLSGEYYSEFLENNFVAIGYNEVKLFDLHKSKSGNTFDENALASIIRSAFPEESRPKYIGTQLIDFAYNMQKGDIVVIPSSSSSKISIGEVIETPLYIVDNTSITENNCPFEKRKKIKWIKKDLYFDSLDSKLLFLKYTQRTVTKVDSETSKIIDRLLLPLFVKSEDAHLSIDLRQKDPINAFELFQTWIELFEVVEEFANEEKISFNKEQFEVKINLQSPGTIEFISYSVIGIFILSILVAGIVGAEIEVDTKLIKFKIKTEGIIGKISDYLNHKKDRKFREELIRKIKKMNINPDELVRILEHINNK